VSALKSHIIPSLSSHSTSSDIRSAIDCSPGPGLPATVPASEDQSELLILRQKYDQLLREKEELGERYQTHLRKWQEFKRWYLRDLARSSIKTENSFSVDNVSAVQGSSMGVLGDELGLGNLIVKTEPFDSIVDPNERSPQSRPPINAAVPNSPVRSLPSPVPSHYAQVPVNSAQRCDQISTKRKRSYSPTPPARDGCSPSSLPGSSLKLTSSSDRAGQHATHRHEEEDRNYSAFPFSDVVRKQSTRKHLVAEDCSCCHDYYQVIEKVPQRPQPPSWRTPKKHKPFPLFADEENWSAVDAHRQQISRHRVHWKGPQTPPKYWSIGFPSTQDAISINEQAEKLYREKQKQ